jgi:hypothetical protein
LENEFWNIPEENVVERDEAQVKIDYQRTMVETLNTK